MKKKRLVISVFVTLFLLLPVLQVQPVWADFDTEATEIAAEAVSLPADSSAENAESATAETEGTEVQADQTVVDNSEASSQSDGDDYPLPAAAQADNSQVTIIHTNDVHGRMQEADGVIGDAKLAAIVNQARSQGKTLVFDSGDVFQGLPISNSSQGEDMADILNAIGFDAMTLGNHEFDFGLDQLLSLSEKLTFPIISSNVYIDGVRLFEAATVIDIDDTVSGDEFVVIGVTTPETATKTHPNNVVGITFTDPITEVNQVIAQLEANARAEGKTYNHYVILAHLGIDTTTPVHWQGTALAQALADNELLQGKTVLVLDGHSHTVLTATYGNVTYNQTGSYLNNVGLVTLNADRVLSAGVISAAEAESVSPDPDIAALISEIEAKYEAETSAVIISESPVELNGDRMNVRVRETNLGNAVADALLDYGQTGFTHQSNLAVMNGGGLRETIKAGEPVTKGDTIAVLPFGNIISQIEVSGQDIYDMFVQSLGSILQASPDGSPVFDENGQPLLEPSGGFLQAAGVTVYYDTNLDPADRILAISVWDPLSNSYKPLDLTATYYLATNDFLAAGGDGYTMLGGAREEGPSLDEVFAAYLAQADLTQYADINPNSRLISLSRAQYIARNISQDEAEEAERPFYPGNALAQPSVAVAKQLQGLAEVSVFLASADSSDLSAAEIRPSSPVKCPLPAAEYKEGLLPNSGDTRSTVIIAVGVLLIFSGLYGSRRDSYRKRQL
ncbi:5'-nucleotidase C-terminal domain-containing protein [Streptococcus sp. H49]|uniref:5'-nucleotidase C-terminal domain-containing protein n=1 Tax=Streptococcus huangxiaojuni TaxID=3237239 RepID=UPI0034A5A3FD